jgi:hypothetical protein
LFLFIAALLFRRVDILGLFVEVNRIDEERSDDDKAESEERDQSADEPAWKHQFDQNRLSGLIVGVMHNGSLPGEGEPRFDKWKVTTRLALCYLPFRSVYSLTISDSLCAKRLDTVTYDVRRLGVPKNFKTPGGDELRRHTKDICP